MYAGLTFILSSNEMDTQAFSVLFLGIREEALPKGSICSSILPRLFGTVGAVFLNGLGIEK